jgi:hypothetical protein
MKNAVQQAQDIVNSGLKETDQKITDGLRIHEQKIRDIEDKVLSEIKENNAMFNLEIKDTEERFTESK